MIVRSQHSGVELPFTFTAKAENNSGYRELSVEIHKDGVLIADILIGMQHNDTLEGLPAYEPRVLVSTGNDPSEHRVAIYPARTTETTNIKW